MRENRKEEEEEGRGKREDNGGQPYSSFQKPNFAHGSVLAQFLLEDSDRG